jgi:cytochrome c556
MNSKWAALGGTLAAAILFAGLAATAQDENDSPLLKIMKQVQTENAKIVKGVRNAASYTKGKTEVSKSSEGLVKLLKDARPLGKSAIEGPHNEQKKTVTDWNKLMDDCVKETADFATLTAKADTNQQTAKKEFAKVTKSCTACHDVFRVEE